MKRTRGGCVRADGLKKTAVPKMVVESNVYKIVAIAKPHRGSRPQWQLCSDMPEKSQLWWRSGGAKRVKGKDACRGGLKDIVAQDKKIRPGGHLLTGLWDAQSGPSEI